ncbi:Npun_F5749 family FMN-dependent PPOX-type flavoprotein [Leptolyngbya sp. AN02str]|uniref:Npun_F5749 family FMN-dependent PPOX-type flavoprotein n=1 Tax=Leptolyngbya sp. AN02str TaxID=3423363 RepID=UPI003D3181E7
MPALLAPWRSPLARALHRNRSLVYARYAQLATVRANGRPANRTVVFRGFWQDGNQLKFICDRRSQKVDQLVQQPWGELCWYFPKTREQFRLLGSLQVVTATEPNETLQTARRSQWHDLSDNARVQFAWPHPRAPRTDDADFAPPPPNPLEPLGTFCLLLLDPVEVDHLELRGEPQQRVHFCREADQWTTTEVNP